MMHKLIANRSKQRWINDFLVLALTIVIVCSYFIFNSPQDNLHILKLGIDDAIPRLPVFSIPYLAFIPWLWAVVLYAWLRDKAFHQLAYSIMITNLIAFVAYVFFQTYIPRDPIVDSDLFSQILGFIYGHDLAYAGFPSLHSGLSAVVATYFVCRKSKWAWAFILGAMIIVVSTLFTKQHFVLDAVSGVALGTFVTCMSFLFFAKNEIKLNDKLYK